MLFVSFADVFNTTNPSSRLTCVSQSPLFSIISSFQMQFMLLFSRQGKLRLQKWYVPLSDKEKKKITRELVQTVLARKPKMCSFLEWRDLKVVYKRYVEIVTETQIFNFFKICNSGCYLHITKHLNVFRITNSWW